jgi:hypothetical protein
MGAAKSKKKHQLSDPLRNISDESKKKINDESDTIDFQDEQLEIMHELRFGYGGMEFIKD